VRSVVEDSRLVQAWRASRVRAGLADVTDRWSSALDDARTLGGWAPGPSGALATSRLAGRLSPPTPLVDPAQAPADRADLLGAGTAVLAFALVGALAAPLAGAPWGALVALVALATTGAALAAGARRPSWVEASWVFAGRVTDAIGARQGTKPEPRGEDERPRG
jgi:hypothetical protein